MSLNSKTTRNNYVGDDNTSVYSYTFKIYTNADLKVLVRNISTGVQTTLTITTDYTVTGAGASAGGSVALVNSGQAWLTGAGKLNDTYEISISRSRDYLQTADIKNQGDFYPEVHETVFDKIVMLLQQLFDLGKRSLRMKESVNPADFDMELPGTFVGAESRAVVTNSTGDGWELGPTATEIANAESSGAAAVASAAAALASQNSASLSAVNAATSETNALAAEVAAEAAQAAAEAAAASIDVVPYIEGDRSNPTDIVAGTGVLIVQTSKFFQTIYVAGDAGAVNISANPQIEQADNNGTKLRLIGCSDTNTVTLEDGNGLELNGSMVLSTGSVIELEWDGTTWLECFRNGL